MTSTETLGRVRDLLAIQSAAVLGVSYEPGWTDVDLTPYLQALKWVVLGGESGADTKPFCLDWATRQIDAGASAGVPVFVKQLGRVPHDDMGILYLADGHGGDWREWPNRLQVRQMPVWTRNMPRASIHARRP